MEFTTNKREQKIPDAETRAKSVARWRQVNLMLDELNMTLDLALAQAEMDLQSSPLYESRRQRAKMQLEAYGLQQLKEQTNLP